MATPLSGRYCSVRIGTTTISSLGTWEVAINFDTAEVAEFGTVWKKALPMMQGWSGSITGFFDASTAAGDQLLNLLNSAVDATKLQDIRFYTQTSSGNFLMPAYSTSMATQSTDAGAYITNVRVTADKNGLMSGSYDVLGYGALALFQGNSSTIVVESTA